MDCPPWPDDRYGGDPERAAALRRRLDDTLAELHGGGDPGFAAEPSRTLCRWHRALFGGTTPLDCYAGTMRGAHPDAPCMARNVRVGPLHGVPWDRVADEVEAFDREARARIAAADAAHAARAPGWEEAVLEEVGWIAAEILRIHPFVNGNGRVCRLAVQALFLRYGFSPDAFPVEPPPGPVWSAMGRLAMHFHRLPMRDFLMSQLGLYPRGGPVPLPPEHAGGGG
jgi:fido (protein-threonine AMPylation protein)